MSTRRLWDTHELYAKCVRAPPYNMDVLPSIPNVSCATLQGLVKPLGDVPHDFLVGCFVYRYPVTLLFEGVLHFILANVLGGGVVIPAPQIYGAGLVTLPRAAPGGHQRRARQCRPSWVCVRIVCEYNASLPVRRSVGSAGNSGARTEQLYNVKGHIWSCVGLNLA